MIRWRILNIDGYLEFHAKKMMEDIWAALPAFLCGAFPALYDESELAKVELNYDNAGS